MVVSGGFFYVIENKEWNTCCTHSRYFFEWWKTFAAGHVSEGNGLHLENTGEAQVFLALRTSFDLH